MANISILTAFAHPDDECFGFGGSLAKYASQAAEITLLCATGGEVGEISDPALATPENLSRVREEELRQSARVLGAKEIKNLGYRDSGMAGTSDNDNPLCLHQANATEAVGRIVKIIREIRPQILLTHDPTGGYGHPDHIAISRHTTTAYHSAGDPTKYPEQISEGLEPWTPAKLYYSVFPRRRFHWLEKRMAEAGIEPPFSPEERESLGVPDDVVTTVIDVAAYTDTKLAALNCHRTQANTFQFFSRLPQKVIMEFMGMEHFWLVEPAPQGQETDLLEGLMQT